MAAKRACDINHDKFIENSDDEPVIVEPYDDDSTSEPPTLPIPTNVSIKQKRRRKPDFDEDRNFLCNIYVVFVTLLVAIVSTFWVLSSAGFLSHENNLREQKAKPRPTSKNYALNYALNFPEQYPKLEIKTSRECRAAWEALEAVPCHDAIWTRSWDAGIPKVFGGQAIDRYVPAICDEICTRALTEANKTISSACRDGDEYDVRGYSGRFNTSLLEPSPSGVLHVLLERQVRTCRKSPAGDAERGYCMTDLNSRWNIVDGIRSNGLDGLRWFLKFTDNPRIERAGRHSGRQGSGGKNPWSENYDYWREERKFGPGRGETTCSWCTLTWFEEKIRMWEEGKIVVDGSAIDLIEFLRMWQKAGKRCAGDRWENMYAAALKSYRDRGLLDEDWDRKPTGNISYLITHGPSAGDYPIPEIDELITFLQGYSRKTAKVPLNKGREKRLELVDEYVRCLGGFKTAAQDLEAYPFLKFPNMTTHVLKDFRTAQIACSENSLRSIDKFERAVSQACPRTRGGWGAYDKKLKMVHNKPLFSLQTIFGRNSLTHNYELVCRSADSSRGRGVPCGAVFAQWGVEEWSLQFPPQAKGLIRTTRQLLKQLPEMPQKLKNWKYPGRKLTPEEKETYDEHTAWRERIEEGVCSDCLWRRFVERYAMGFPLIPKSEEDSVAMEWIKTIHLLRDGCKQQGKEFMEIELDNVNVEWKK